jgi:polyhydroxybutyrate depolymerase
MKSIFTKLTFLIISFVLTPGEALNAMYFGNGTKVKVVTKVDGVDREYFIHIPMNYTGSQEVPLVFMLHGTAGDGETFYNAYGWTELADKEGFLAVFPSSGKYRINDNGEIKTITKWNTIPDADWTFVPGEKPLDDIKFLRKIIDEMKSNYKVDAKRIYLNGFSNGGQMAAKCAIEMSDVLAAACSNASAFFLDTIYIPKRKLPYLYEVGNKDYGPGNEGPEFPEVPLSYFDSLISTPGISYLQGKHYKIDNNCVRNFNLKREHTIAGDTSYVMVATHQPNKPGPGTGYEFKFIFVKGLSHDYPNGKNHPYDAVTNHWNWMKQFILEDSTTKANNSKIRVVTKIENVDREYFIHIPANFDSTKQVPLVMFFHGGGQDGNLYYNISGWNEVADTAHILMVYPSALSYCVVENGIQKMLSQWNNGHESATTFCPNQTLKDDVLFVKTILQQMSTRYKIDPKRMYTVGFSNGGEFAASRTAIELSDKIAASISSGGGGALPRDTILTPKRKLPVMLMFGNKDDRLLKAVNAPVSVPMGFQPLYSVYPMLYNAQVAPYVNSFGLDDKNYITLGDTNNLVAAIFKGKSGDPLNVFYLVEVKNLEHEYPNGINHPIQGAIYHWRWLRQYSLAATTPTTEEVKTSFTSLKIYPNPTFNQVKIPNVKTWRIYNTQGQLVLTGKSESVNVSSLNTGTYYVSSDLGSGRFIKQ